MRVINFEKGSYYEAPKKSKKNKYAQRIAALEAAVEKARGAQWYAGPGSPFTIPRSEWSPNAEINEPRFGDLYLNTRTGEYSQLAPLKK
jgi:hypothetical protein